MSRQSSTVNPHQAYSDKIHEAIRSSTLQQAMRDERDLVKLIARSHSCENNWAGTHCVVCSDAQAVAIKVADLFNTTHADMRTEIEQLRKVGGPVTTKSDLASSGLAAIRERVSQPIPTDFAVYEEALVEARDDIRALLPVAEAAKRVDGWDRNAAFDALAEALARLEAHRG